MSVRSQVQVWLREIKIKSRGHEEAALMLFSKIEGQPLGAIERCLQQTAKTPDQKADILKYIKTSTKDALWWLLHEKADREDLYTSRLTQIHWGNMRFVLKTKDDENIPPFPRRVRILNLDHVTSEALLKLAQKARKSGFIVFVSRSNHAYITNYTKDEIWWLSRSSEDGDMVTQNGEANWSNMTVVLESSDHPTPLSHKLRHLIIRGNVKLTSPVTTEFLEINDVPTIDYTQITVGQSVKLQNIREVDLSHINLTPATTLNLVMMETVINPPPIKLANVNVAPIKKVSRLHLQRFQIETLKLDCEGVRSLSLDLQHSHVRYLILRSHVLTLDFDLTILENIEEMQYEPGREKIKHPEVYRQIIDNPRISLTVKRQIIRGLRGSQNNQTREFGHQLLNELSEQVGLKDESKARIAVYYKPYISAKFIEITPAPLPIITDPPDNQFVTLFDQLVTDMFNSGDRDDQKVLTMYHQALQKVLLKIFERAHSDAFKEKLFTPVTKHVLDMKNVFRWVYRGLTLETTSVDTKAGVVLGLIEGFFACQTRQAEELNMAIDKMGLRTGSNVVLDAEGREISANLRYFYQAINDIKEQAFEEMIQHIVSKDSDIHNYARYRESIREAFGLPDAMHKFKEHGIRDSDYEEALRSFYPHFSPKALVRKLTDCINTAGRLKLQQETDKQKREKTTTKKGKEEEVLDQNEQELLSTTVTCELIPSRAHELLLLDILYHRDKIPLVKANKLWKTLTGREHRYLDDPEIYGIDPYYKDPKQDCVTEQEVVAILKALGFLIQEYDYEADLSHIDLAPKPKLYYTHFPV